ncbi:MAG: hypothetical protein IJR70_02680 [Eubacterium sp.]|nr:hypothetical protein [Eubacterium sp.]
MKKVLIFVLCAAMTVCVFGACSKKDSKETTAAKSTTVKMTTDSAVIKEADAINLIQSYSNEELGLTKKERKKASFMVAGSGVEVEGDNYIEVVATIKNEHKDGDKVSYTFDHLGMYYIRYDGKKIMRKDMKSKEAKYIDMKIKAVPSTTAAHEHKETSEKTTAKEKE